MKYQPTLYLPMELAHYIDLHLKPIENAMKNMLIQKPFNASSERKLVHNLNCIAEFNEKRDSLLTVTKPHFEEYPCVLSKG